MDKLPENPFILLSYVNTKLRDCCPCLEELCREEEVSPEKLTACLKQIGYEYDPENNRFS